jgi:hypothetical protein
VTVLEADAPPKNGQWIDTCDILPRITDEEIQLGLLLGETIDTEDDEDGGQLSLTKGLVTSERERALHKARSLKAVMLDYGVPEVSIELQEGRPNSFGTWDALFCVSDMGHHTVSRYSPTSLTPVLGLCKHGRSDLPGPLCNGYGGWDLCYRIITFGYANHPGEGGPRKVPALTSGSFTIPQDSARRYSWGTEFEGGLLSSDWDRVLTNPRNGKKMTFREFMGRSNKAIEVYHKIHPLSHMEHSTWTSRKIDRLGYTAQRGIEEKKRYGVKRDWFDMATKEDLKEVIREVLREELPHVPITIDTETKKKWSLQQVLRHNQLEVDRIKTKVQKLLDQPSVGE